jgi:hypothetical protein
VEPVERLEVKPAFIFLFLICGGEAPCYQDVVIARTCAQAEAMARFWLREGQSLHGAECVAQAEYRRRSQ